MRLRSTSAATRSVFGTRSLLHFARLRRFLRKHKTALIAIAVYNFVLFFPTLFMGRVLSPNDVFYSYSPWSSLRSDAVHPQNLLINDPPTSMYTHVAMMKRDLRTFHWVPYEAS